MTWIKTTPLSAADGRLKECLDECMLLYPPEYAVPVEAVADVTDGDGASIVMAHSLLPEVLKHTFSTYGTLLSPQLPLGRRQHELIAATVSALNDCFY
jgi:hypothetical protein